MTWIFSPARDANSQLLQVREPRGVPLSIGSFCLLEPGVRLRICLCSCGSRENGVYATMEDVTSARTGRFFFVPVLRPELLFQGFWLY